MSNHPPIYSLLIHKLEKHKFPRSLDDDKCAQLHNGAIDDCIAIVRQHNAPNGKKCIMRLTDEQFDVAWAAIQAMGDASARKDEDGSEDRAKAAVISTSPATSSNPCYVNVDACMTTWRDESSESSVNSDWQKIEDVLEEASRIIDYFANGKTLFVGSGTPVGCLERLNHAMNLVAAMRKHEPAFGAEWQSMDAAPTDGTVILGDYSLSEFDNDVHTVMYMKDWHGEGKGQWRDSVNSADWSEPKRWMHVPGNGGDALARKDRGCAGSPVRQEAASVVPTSPSLLKPVMGEENKIAAGLREAIAGKGESTRYIVHNGEVGYKLLPTEQPDESSHE